MNYVRIGKDVEGRKKKRRMRNELKGATENPKKNISRADVTRSQNFKEGDVMIKCA